MESAEDARQLDDQWTAFRSRGDAPCAERDVRDLFELLATYEQQTSDPAPRFAAELRKSLIASSNPATSPNRSSRQLGILNHESGPYLAPSRTSMVIVFAIALLILAAAVFVRLDFAGSSPAGWSLATLQAETVQMTQTAIAGESTATVIIES